MDLNGFNKGLPFNDDHPLSEHVNSDHSAIGCVIKYDNDHQVVIKAVNISNKEYHPYFGLGDNPPFKNTHMYVPKDCKDQNKKDWLITKTKEQMDGLVDDITNDRLDIQIVIEGYFDFFVELEQRLEQASPNTFKIISILNNKDHGYNGSPKNITGIIVNTKRFEIFQCDTIVQDYREDDKNSKLILPWVKVCDKLTSTCLIVLGIHLPGCSSQNPKGALVELNKIMNSLYETHQNDMVALGDYNTVPNNIRSVFANVSVLTPLFPTHINPNNDIVTYDNVSCIFNGVNAKSIELIDIENLPVDSGELVKSLRASFIS
jgi:hypothetical protein